MGQITQNLQSLERVYNTRITQGPPKPPSVAGPRVITVMCKPLPEDTRFRAIPYAPKRRAVEHYQRLSSFTTETENTRRSEARIQRRTDALMKSLRPYIGHDGTVVRGCWDKVEEL